MASRESVRHFDEQWPEIRKFLEEIYLKGPTKLDFMRLSGLVHRFRMFQMLDEGLECKLLNFLNCIMKPLHDRLQSKDGEDLLCDYVKYWKKYDSLTRILLFTFSCTMNARHHNISFPYVEWPKNIKFDIEGLSYTCWAEWILDPLAPKLTNAVLLFTKTLDEIATNKTAVYHFICSLSEYGTVCHSKGYCKCAEHCFYKTIIELPLLHNAEEFFETKSVSMLNYSFIDMLKEIEDLYHKIANQTYLHASTQKAVINCFDDIVMRNAFILFLKEFHTSLVYHQIGNLREIFEFLDRFKFFPSCVTFLNFLKQEFQTHIYEEGLEALINNGTKVGSVAYVGRILNIYSLYYNLIRSVCAGNAFESALDTACEKFINDQSCNNGASEILPAEMLVKYCHSLLVKNDTGISEKDCLEKICEALKILKFINEKDVFVALYSKRLVKRFLRKTYDGQISKEENAVSKIIDVCDFEGTIKLKKLFSDICFSKDFNKEFKRYVKVSDKLKFFAFVINSRSWPFNIQSSFENILLPDSVQQSSKLFTHFYISKFKERKLKFLHLFAVGELVSNCFDKPYIFEASALQIVILHQFNTKDTFSLIELKENTGVDLDSLIKILTNLLKIKLLTSIDKVLNPASFVSLQLSYCNCKQKISIIPNKLKDKDVKAYNNCTQNRKLLIKAAIVRIMKKMKTMELHHLFLKISDELSKQFVPELSMVKTCIQSLTEEEYLKCENENCYSYITDHNL